MGAFLGSYLGTALRQAFRNAQHTKMQTAGHQIVAQRMQITAPWQPEMVNYPSFLCAHCQFPHVLWQTLLGCSTCAAPYFPSEVARLNKNGTLQCVACDTNQNIDRMLFCCIHCRCIQGVPAQLQWRKTYAKLPVWRVYLGPIITAAIGLLAFLICLGTSLTSQAGHQGDMRDLGIFFGVLSLGIAGLASLPIVLRKPMPSELMMSCGGFGYRKPTGEEVWFAWRDVSGLESAQPIRINDATTGHPDSMAVRWAIRVGQERLVFDSRLDQAREFARQIRMRAPAAQLADLPPVERQNPWLVLILCLLVIAICFGFVAFATQK